MEYCTTALMGMDDARMIPYLSHLTSSPFLTVFPVSLSFLLLPILSVPFTITREQVGAQVTSASQNIAA